MDSMDMGNGSPHACKISMLWNWYTVDACFISTQWHIHSKVAFAFMVICVFLVTGLVEGVRRASREYDRRLVVSASFPLCASTQSVAKDVSAPSARPVFRPTVTQQCVRGAFFGVQFGAAYILMLLAMYYNGFIIFAIILGGTAGFVIFGKDTIAAGGHGEQGAACC